METLKCDVCSKPAKGVCSSIFGAVSCALCQDCLNKGLEPWTYVVASGLTYNEYRDDYKPTVDAIMKHYGKTEMDLNMEVNKANEEYEKWLSEQPVDDHVPGKEE